MPRRSIWLPLGALFACLVILAGCKKKPPAEDSSSSGDPIPKTGTAPASVSSDHFLFARVDVKSIRSSTLFAEIKQGVAKAGEWDKLEAESLKNAGLKPTDVDTVTACIVDISMQGAPKAVVIVAANKAVDKTAILREASKNTPDSPFFYDTNKGVLIHFPDDKTFVYVHPDLAQKYLDGYAKDRSGWPLTAGLTQAATGHTAYVLVNVDKVPAEARGAPDAKELGALLSAKKVVVTAKLKDKELSATVRGTFPDAATAGKAKDTVTGYVGFAASMIGQVAGGKAAPETAAFLPAITEGQRALKAAKVEAVGSDVVVTASYKADFDVGRMVADLVKQASASGARMTAQNNLKQIALALINYADRSNGRLPVLGVGANGAILKTAAEQPLLSWRVAILPYIEQNNLYNQFKLNEPWNGPNNKKLIDQMPKVYAPAVGPGKPGYTHFQMVVGPNAMKQPFAVFPTSFTDGTSNTVAVAEAAEPVIWTKPDDIMLPAKLAPGELKKKFGGLFPGGFNVVMWDGTVRFVKDTVSERTLGLAINPADGQPLGSDW